MGSHFFKFLKIDQKFLDLVCPAAGYGNEPPPPEIYCPAEGYIPDPTIYHEDPIITEAPRPPVGQIRLIATDSGSRHIQFKCTVSSSEQYTVIVTGANDTVIETQTKNNNAVFSTFLPLGAGYLAEGYTYYYIDIAPAVDYDLTLFQATINETYDESGGFIIAAYFNTPEILDLNQMFKDNKRVKYIEFVSNANSLITLKECCYGADELEKFVFPAQMNNLLDVESGWKNTINFKEINFNDVSTPVLENMQHFLNGTGLKEFVFQKNIDSVLSLVYGLNNSKNLEKVTLYESAANLEYIDSLFRECDKLKGKMIYPEMPSLINFEYIHRNNHEVEEIQFLGSYDDETIVTNGREMFLNCKKVKKIKYPEKIWMANNVFNSIAGCEELEYLILPKKWWWHTDYQVSTPYKTFFLNFVTNPKLKEISTIEETDKNLRFAVSASLAYTPLVEEFIQPNIRWSSVGTDTGSINFEPLPGAVSKLKKAELDCSGGILAVYIRGTQITTANLMTLISTVARKNSMANTQLHYRNSPVEDDVKVSSLSLKNYEMKVRAGDVPGVGNTITRRYASYNIAFSVNTGTSTISTGNYHYANNTKISFRGTETSEDGSGVEFYKTYYVINSNGNEFQISETLGGSAVSFLKDFSIFAYMQAELKVLSVSGDMLNVNVAFPSGNINSGSNNYHSSEINLFEANKNGWLFNSL